MFSKYLENVLNIPINEEIALKEYHYNKQMLKRVFKNQLIHEKEIVLKNNKHSSLKSISKTLDNYQSLLKTLFDYHNNVKQRNLFYMFDSTNLYYDNKINYNITLEDNKKFPKGTKPFKVLNYLAKQKNIDIEQFRIEISKALQYKELKTTLCLSIHPIDFLTLSDNNSNWSSCLSILNNGCYHQGIIEMLNSPYVFIAYCKSKKDYENSKGLVWNDKIARSLFIYNGEFILPVKEYPQKNDSFIEEATKFFLELIDRPDAQKQTYNPYWEKIEESDQYLRFETDIMYNDIIEDDYNRDIYLLTEKITETVINYSGPCTCLSCGQEFGQYGEEHDNLVCKECGGFIPCSSCGDDCSEDEEEYYDEDGNRICKSCYNYINQKCPICHKVIGGLGMRYIDFEMDRYGQRTWFTGCQDCLKPDSGQTDKIPFQIDYINYKYYYTKQKLLSFGIEEKYLSEED